MNGVPGARGPGGIHFSRPGDHGRGPARSLTEIDRGVARAILAGDPRATHELGRWLPAACGVGLLIALFVPWYSLSIATAGGSSIPVDIASTALQWMPGTSWIIASVAIIVTLLSLWQARMGSFRDVSDRFVNRFELVLATVGLAVVIWRTVAPPSLPGSSARYHLVGQVGLGPLLAITLVLVMLVGLWIRRAELLVGEAPGAAAAPPTA